MRWNSEQTRTARRAMGLPPIPDRVRGDIDHVAAARREGVIEGLERALELALTPMPHDPALVKLIRAEIERIKGA